MDRDPACGNLGVIFPHMQPTHMMSVQVHLDEVATQEKADFIR